MADYEASTYGDRIAAVYDQFRFPATQFTNATVEFLASVADDTPLLFSRPVPVIADVPALGCRCETLAAQLGPHRLFRECIHDLPLGFGFVARLEVVLG
jgi:hypothetical protein